MVSIKSLQYDEVGLIYPYQQNAKTDADFYWESLEEEDIAYLWMISMYCHGRSCFSFSKIPNIVTYLIYSTYLVQRIYIQ
jgi:type III secretory pathway lipoprotein EscJ